MFLQLTERENVSLKNTHCIGDHGRSPHGYGETTLGLALDITVFQGALVTDTATPRSRVEAGSGPGAGGPEGTGGWQGGGASVSRRLVTRPPNSLLAFTYLLFQATNLQQVTRVDVVFLGGQFVQFQ